MEEKRPDPEALLRMLQEPSHHRGRLKIFFGYAAGVGKTYAMLEAAHAAKYSGTDVVCGYLEPHTRPETMALAQGLETLALRKLSYKNICLNELDLDAALARHPQLLLVDELAHTNGEGCRHRKRYQDIEELLTAGIDVYTTVNVQHIESLNDQVAAITGVTVRERVPDSVFDRAEQVEVVDIEPSDLIHRLNQGKIYREQQAQKALNHFFTQGHLEALREIALRRTADRLNRDKELRVAGLHTEEHILICLSSSPSNAKVVRAGARLAEAFHGRFTALFVETPGTQELSEENRKRLRENLRLAEQLGAQIATVYGDDVPMQIAQYAEISAVSKIILGRANNQKHLLRRGRTLVEKLTAQAPTLDIYIIPDNLPPYHKRRAQYKADPVSLADVLKTIGILAISTAIGYLFLHFGFRDTNVITTYILGVLVIALLTNGRICSGVASIVSVLLFNFCFTSPLYTLQFDDPSYFVTFLITFLSAFLTSGLAMRVKRQARQETQKSYRTTVLLETSQKLQRARAKEEICTAAALQMGKLLDRSVLVYPAGEAGLQAALFFPHAGEDGAALMTSAEQAVAQWVYQNHKHAGAGTDTLPGAKCLYMAVRNQSEVFAVVGISMENQRLEAFEKNLLLALLGEFALALEMELLDADKKQVEIKAQQEQLRANLLRAISHDLRTPLTSISGNAGVLMGNEKVLNGEQRQRLYSDIYDDSMWLINLVENLLAVTRIEKGAIGMRLEPELWSEILNEAMSHVDRKRVEHCICVSAEDDLLMSRMDSRLIIQVLINLVDNAITYTPAGSHITVSAVRNGEWAEVSVADDGPGIPDEAKKKLFDMFYTAGNVRGDGRRGLGLGLSLCKSIVEAHGATLGVGDTLPQGTTFYLKLKAEEVDCHE